MDEKHYDIIEDENKNQQDQYHNDIFAQVVFTMLTLALVFSVFGVILLANLGSNSELKAYACEPDPTSTPTAIPFTSLGDASTDPEWSSFSTMMPNEERTDIRVLDRSANRQYYNCASWSITHVTNSILSPSLTMLLTAIDDFYGFDVCSATDTDCSLIILDDSNTPGGWDHVMNRWEGEGPPWDKRAKFSDGEDVWESKLGEGKRIIHRIDAFTGNTINYGTPTYYYKRQ